MMTIYEGMPEVNAGTKLYSSKRFGPSGEQRLTWKLPSPMGV